MLSFGSSAQKWISAVPIGIFDEEMEATSVVSLRIEHSTWGVTRSIDLLLVGTWAAVQHRVACSPSCF